MNIQQQILLKLRQNRAPAGRSGRRASSFLVVAIFISIQPFMRKLFFEYYDRYYN